MSKKSEINMVNALILNKNNHALIIHNCKRYGDKRNDRWECPGGKVKKEESLEEATIREVGEKLSVKIKVIKRDRKKILGDYETNTLEGKFKCRTYHAKITEGEPAIPESEKENIDRFAYLSYNQLLHLNVQGTLAPNLVLALTKLREYVE